MTARIWRRILPVTLTYTGADVFSVGDLIKIDSELMAVTGVDEGTNTLTVVRGSLGTSTAHGIVELRALVDGDAALPGWVTFCSREQTLSAEFAGILQECVPVDSTEDLAADITATDLTLTYTGADVFSVGDLIKIDSELMAVTGVDEGTNTLTVVRGSLGTIQTIHLLGADIFILDCPPETVELILSTLDANSFNFIMPDLTSGVHTVEIEARITVICTKNGGPAVCNNPLLDVEAEGVIGQGSVTIELVRMIQGEDVELP